MPTLNDLKERAEQLCPYPIGPWRDAKFGRRAQLADSAFARCKGHKAMVSVRVRPPKGVPHIALLEEGNTTSLEDKVDEPPEQLQLL